MGELCVTFCVELPVLADCLRFVQLNLGDTVGGWQPAHVTRRSTSPASSGQFGARCAGAINCRCADDSY